MKKEKTPKSELLPKKRGVKSKYKPWMCEKLVEIAGQGGHISQMCLAIGIKSRDTYYRWLKEHPEFREAHNESRLVSQAFYENLLLAGALGKIPNFNFNSLSMIIMNKFRDDYCRSSTGPNTNINIGSINSIGSLDNKQLDKKIKQLQTKLDLIPSKDEDQ